MQKKERIVVICPGRGSYTSETLGYLKKPRAPRVNIGDFVVVFVRVLKLVPAHPGQGPYQQQYDQCQHEDQFVLPGFIQNTFPALY